MTKKRGRSKKRVKFEEESPSKKIKLMENISNQSDEDGDEENQDAQNDPPMDTHVNVRSRALKEKLKIKIYSPKNLRSKKNTTQKKEPENENEGKKSKDDAIEAKKDVTESEDTGIESERDDVECQGYATAPEDISLPIESNSESQEKFKSVTFLLVEDTDKTLVESELDLSPESNIVDNQSSNEQLVLDKEKDDNLDMLLMGLEENTPTEVPGNSYVLFVDGAEDYVVLPTQFNSDNPDLVNINNIVEEIVIPNNKGFDSENIKSVEDSTTVENQVIAENIESVEDIETGQNQVTAENIEGVEDPTTVESQVMQTEEDHTMDTDENQDTEFEENQVIHTEENRNIEAEPNQYIENQNIQDIIEDSKNIECKIRNKMKEKDISDEVLMKAAKKLKSKKTTKTKVITKSKSSKITRKTKPSTKSATAKATIETVPSSPINQHTVNEEDEIMCKMCDQKINNQLVYHNGQPIGGFEEGAAILDSKLLLFDGDEANVSTEDTRSYNKITSFSIYCKNGHLCHFDSGLIEKDVEIFFSGYVKPIHSDDPSPKDGVPGKKFGPMVWWWMTGFDVGEQPTVGLTTELGDYICMEPSAEYAPFMRTVMTKIYISKIVIEFLIYEPNASYEDLLSKLQTTPVPNDLMKNFTEDTLLHYAPFICDQVITFDDTAKPKEQLIVTAPCIRRLIDLAGIRFEVDPSEAPHKAKQIFRERQFEHKIDYREKLLRQVAEDKRENSGASELIDVLLPIHEKSSKISKSGRCGVCERCARSRCRECKACSAKKYDACYQRRCFNYEIMEENEQDALDEMNFIEKGEDSFSRYRKSVRPLAHRAYDIAWGTKPVLRENKRIYYGCVYVDCQMISPGDFVDVRSNNDGVPPQIMKVAYMYEDEDTGECRVHANFLWSGKYTVLGDISDRKELFFVNRCIDVDVKCVVKKVHVHERTNANLDNSMVEDQVEHQYVCLRSYNALFGSFHDLRPDDQEARGKYGAAHRYCSVCDHNNMKIANDIPRPFNKIDEMEDKVTYELVRYKNEEYRVGTSVYLKPKSLYFKYPMFNNPGQTYSKQLDEEKFSEVYRKAKDEDAIPNDNVSAPFDIGYIKEIYTSEDKVLLKVTALYRPENTHKSAQLSKNANVNMLYWSEDEKILPFSCVISKCYITHLHSIRNENEWSKQGPDRFYFSQIYKGNDFIDIDKGDYGCPYETCDAPVYPEAKLKTLNIFAGCGGLALGLQQAGAAVCKWAIEADEAAAATFKLNNPEAAVFVGTSVEMMEKISKKDFKVNDQRLPKKGNVELLCATLPSESWRSINSVDAFKGSNITTFLVYVEYYQPPFFVLETDDVLLKRSIVLKFALASFIRLGYQVAFDLMQVGNFGAPQNRYRTVIIGASRGRTLPDCPKSQYVFSKSFSRGCVVIDNTMFQRRNWTESAPFKPVTVRDAILDLSALEINQNEEFIKYSTQSVSFYHRMMRYDLAETDKQKVFNHVGKDLGPLVHARMSQVPIAPGSDWRNLPNIEMQLRDKTFTKKLVYSYNDPELCKGQSKGVCSCSEGKRCDPEDVQENTLIPWHLVHSGKRHGHWAGLYGKLQWDGIFTGTWTNPEPLAKKAPVIHPSKSRVLSVRECARAQGFPDSFIFANDFPVHKMYRQIGLATSPLLARAIGYEIAKSATLNAIQ